MAFIKTKQVFHGTFVSVKEWHRSSIAASSVRCPSTSHASLTRSCRPSSPETCNHHCEGWGVCWNRILDKLFLCLLILSAETKAGGEIIQITNHWHCPVASPSVLSAVWVGLQSMSRLRQKTCSSWSNRWVEPHRPTVWAIEQEAASPSGSAGISSLEEKHRLPYWFQSKTQNRKRSILRVGTTPTLCRSERHALKCQRES